MGADLTAFYVSQKVKHIHQKGEKKDVVIKKWVILS